MNKLLTIVFGTLVVVSACKKKHEEVIPVSDLSDQNSPGNSTMIFKPKKIFSGTDSLNLSLDAAYTFDNVGRIDTAYNYKIASEHMLNYYIGIYKYIGDSAKMDLYFLNMADKKLYKAGYNFTVYNAQKRPVKSYSLGNYYTNIISGIDTGDVYQTSMFSYTFNDSMATDIKISDYNKGSSEIRYIFNKSGNIIYAISGDTLIFSQYEPSKGRFADNIDQSMFSIYQNIYSDHLPKQWYSTFGGVKYYRNMTWKYNREGYPISATVDYGNGKIYYRFEY